MSQSTVFWASLSVLALLYGCKQPGSTQEYDPNSTPTTVMTKMSIDVPRTYVADIQGVQFVEIKPKVGGFIETIFIDEGEKVRKGDKLFQLSSTELSENIREAETALKQAEAEYQMAEYEASRIRRLVEKDIISPIRLQHAEAELEVAKLRVEQASVQLKRSQVNFGYTTITAPYDGYVDRIPYKVGSLVNTESLLTTISDVSEVFAYYKMNETDYLKFKRAQLSGNMRAEMDSIRLILPDGSVYEHPGRVETVEGDFERGTGSIAFRARFPNPVGLLRHGVTGKVSMTTPMDDVFLVPQQSTFEIQEFTYVYVVRRDGTVEVRSFEPLSRYRGFYVAQDFEDSTEIVYSGIQGIKDGMRIKKSPVPFRDILENE